MPVGPPGAPVQDSKPLTRVTQAWTRLWYAALRDGPRNLRNARRYSAAARRGR